MTLSIDFGSKIDSKPVELVPTDFDFDAPRLLLDGDELMYHRIIFANSLGNVAVLRSLSTLLEANDEYTYDHGLRTGWGFAAGAARLGLPLRDAIIGTQAAITHDVGKHTDRIQQAIRSTDRVDVNHRLYDAISEHPLETLRVYERHNLGPNHRTISGHHHDFSPRYPYGEGGPIKGMPEEDGYIPYTPLLTYMLPVMDTYDALSVDPEVSGRRYLDGSEVGHKRAMAAIGGLTLPAEYAYLKDLPNQVIAH